MQFSSLITALTASVALAAPIDKRSSGKAIIINNCGFDVKITPWVNGSPTTQSTIPAGQSWSEVQRGSGQSTSLKVSLESGSNNVAQFEYTTNNDMALVFYDLSFLDGNPFSAWKQVLTGGEGDPDVSCAAGELPCQEAYFFPDQVATKAAPMGTDLTYEICKKN